MRRHKIFTWSFFILSAINFAFAAPVAARKGPGVRLDPDLTRNATATTASQKRWNSLDERSSLNVPGPSHAPPPSQDSTETWSQLFDVPWSQILQLSQRLEQQHRHLDNPPAPPPPPPDTGSVYVPSNPRLPTGSQLPVGSSPVASFFSSSLPHSPHSTQPGPDDRSPGYSVSSTANNYLPPSPGWPTESRLPVAASLSLPPPHPSQPGPSDGRHGHGSGPPGFSENPGTLSSTGSNDPFWRLELDPEIHSLLDLEPFPTEFWDKFLTGRIKRRVSGSDAVNLAQKDPRLLKISRRRRSHDAPTPSSKPAPKLEKIRVARS